jgi:hypothetical protein
MSVTRTVQRGGRAVSLAWLRAHPGGLAYLAEADGAVVLSAPLRPAADAAFDLGAPGARLRHAYVAELHTGDLILARSTPEGDARWRIVEWPDRIEATDVFGQTRTLLLVGQGGPWWRRWLRQLLLSLLS